MKYLSPHPLLLYAFTEDPITKERRASPLITRIQTHVLTSVYVRDLQS